MCYHHESSHRSSTIQFMHEIGHNFNAGHTHEAQYYNPRIDACGCSYTTGPVNCTTIPCSSQLPLAKSSPIMSYCHLCAGGYANMDYTFGGKYSGTGSRGSITSYTNTPLAGTVTTEARQVNAVMWNHVSTRGTCALPYVSGSTSCFVMMFIICCAMYNLPLFHVH